LYSVRRLSIATSANSEHAKGALTVRHHIASGVPS
jgi:hypothetical protein